MINTDLYKPAIRAEGIAGKHQYGIDIRVAVDRSFTDADRRLFDHVMQLLQKGLLTESVRLDPESAVYREAEREQIKSLFTGIQPYHMKPILNGYCSDHCCSQKPWYEVLTSIGTFVVGWRKRVMHIDWSQTSVIVTASTLFPKDDVTKEGRTIHAWSVADAQRYVKAVYSVSRPDNEV